MRTPRITRICALGCLYGQMLLKDATPIAKAENKIIPAVDRLVYNTEKLENFSHSATKTIGIIDMFSGKQVDIDWDLIPDVSHGFVVSKIIEEGLPNANIKNFDISHDVNISKEQNTSFINIKKILNQIITEIKNGRHYDAINISWGFTVKFSKLNKQFGTSINNQNISNKSKEFKNILNKNKDKIIKKAPLSYEEDIPIKYVTEVINQLDSISASGTKIYIAAGNNHGKSLNLLTLADNIISVGALNSKGKKSFYSDDNSIVSRWEKGELKVKKTKNGFNLIGNDKTDITFDNTSSILKIPRLTKILGTSFSCPRAIVKDFK